MKKPVPTLYQNGIEDAHAVVDAVCAQIRDVPRTPTLTKEIVQAIFSIERRLQDALAGQSMRGMKNILFHKCPLYAWNIRAVNKDDKIEFPDVGQSTEALVLLYDGTLSIVEVHQRRPGFITKELFEPDDEDLQVEDLERLLHTVVEAGYQHWKHSADKTTKTTQRIRDLQFGLQEVLSRS